MIQDSKLFINFINWINIVKYFKIIYRQVKMDDNTFYHSPFSIQIFHINKKNNGLIVIYRR